MELLGLGPGRESFIWLGPHGGANGLAPLLPASPCEPDTSMRVALGKPHVEKCTTGKTLSGGKHTKTSSL